MKKQTQPDGCGRFFIINLRDTHRVSLFLAQQWDSKIESQYPGGRKAKESTTEWQGILLLLLIIRTT